MKATWKHHEDNKELSTKEREGLPDSVYAFPGKRRETLNNASHVRNAIARFDQVKDVTDHEREQAWLLKNSSAGRDPKLRRVRMPYKRFSRVAQAFSVPKIAPFL